MYVPAAFRQEDLGKLHSLMREYSFAVLVTRDGAGSMASHLPMLLDEGAGPLGMLRGHMARGNPQGRALEAQEEVLVIFQGPHAYVSPAWYESRPAVPTWNYAAVHAYARPRVIRDRQALTGLLEAMVRAYDAPLAAGGDVVTADLTERLLPGIVGFELEITRLEGKWKLGQNRSPADRLGAAAALTESGEPLAIETARWMAEAGELP